VSRRARGLALLGAAAACAGLAASSVSRYTNDVRAQVGPLVPVVVARAELRRGTAITPDTAARAFEVRRIPARYAPPRALSSISPATGFRLTLALQPGDYLTDGALSSGGRRGRAGAAAGRTVEIAVAGTGSLAGALEPGTRVDVLITSDRGGGPGRTYLALQDAELLAFNGSAGDAGAGEAPSATAALRVSLRQAVLLTAAQNFARELRLVPRPEDDRRRLGAVAISAADLGG
jgi:pilus assembly protein CpaB